MVITNAEQQSLNFLTFSTMQKPKGSQVSQQQVDSSQLCEMSLCRSKGIFG